MSTSRRCSSNGKATLERGRQLSRMGAVMYLGKTTPTNLNNQKGNKMVEKVKIVKDAVMTAAVIAVVVGVLCFAAGGV